MEAVVSTLWIEAALVGLVGIVEAERSTWDDASMELYPGADLIECESAADRRICRSCVRAMGRFCSIAAQSQALGRVRPQKISPMSVYVGARKEPGAAG